MTKGNFWVTPYSTFYLALFFGNFSQSVCVCCFVLSKAKNRPNKFIYHSSILQFLFFWEPGQRLTWERMENRLYI